MGMIPYNRDRMTKKVDIDHICSLASLSLTQKDKTELVPQMKKIVEWVDKLGELRLDSSKNEEYTPVSFSLPFREDEIKPSFSDKEALANSPEHDGKFMKVPKVIEGK